MTDRFHYFSKFFYKIFSQIEFGKVNLGTIYKKFWNPINYMIIGGIGVIVNYLINFILIGFLPWWVSNAFAILTAWLWNWANSVGSLGYLWGFKRKPRKKTKPFGGEKSNGKR